MTMGIIYNIDIEPNYSVEFPSWDINEERTDFHKYDSLIKVRGSDTAPKPVNLWAIVVPDEKAMGSIYGSLGQIQTLSPSIVISRKMRVVAPAASPLRDKG